MTTTINKAQIAQDFLTGIYGLPGITIHTPGAIGQNGWRANCYWPTGDVVRDISCHGRGDTLEAAIADMLVKLDVAKSAAPVLKTAAECKAAVLDLIREHGAAPASFRDAVDALPVKG